MSHATRRVQRCSGFVLFELVLTLALLAVVASAMLALSGLLQSTQARVEARDTLQSEAALIIQTLRPRITQAIPASLEREDAYNLTWLVRKGVGEWRHLPRADGSGQVFDTTASTGTFDLLGELRHPPDALAMLQASITDDPTDCADGGLCVFFDAAADPRQASATVTALDAGQLDYTGLPDTADWALQRRTVWLYHQRERLTCRPDTGLLALTSPATPIPATASTAETILLSRHLSQCELLLDAFEAQNARLVGLVLQLQHEALDLPLFLQIAVRGH